MAPFSPLSSSEKVGMGHVNKFKSLTTLDLSPLSNVTSIKAHSFMKTTFFAAKCTSLTSIYLSGCSSAVSNEVRNSKKLSKLVVESRLKRSRDESPEQIQKRRRHAQ